MPAQDGLEGKARAALPRKTLLDLPPELFLQIAEFLPTTSAAILSLCNKRFATQLGSSTWKLLSSLDSEDRIDFLTIISRDLPRYHACHGCICLHLSSSNTLPSDLNASVPPSSCITESARSGYSKDEVIAISNYISPYTLRFSHVQLALKQHHHGPEHGISLGDLSHTDITFMEGTAYLFSADARIVSNEMVVRSQEWILSREHPREDFFSKTLTHSVCQHLMTYNGEYGLCDDFTSLLRCRFSHRATDADCACMGLQQCSSCPIEYQIDLVNFKELGTAYCATKWLNLGSGLTTRDLKWQGHNLLHDEYVPHNLLLGSIRSGYESQEGATVDDLSAENKRRLFSSLHMFRNSMYFTPYGSSWKLAGYNVWYIDNSVESGTIGLLFHRLLALSPRSFAQIIGVLLGILMLLRSILGG